MPTTGTPLASEMMTPSLRRRAIIAATLGNGLEFYDFITFAFFAVQIGNTFFPSHSAFLSLMGALATFFAGFLTMSAISWVALNADPSKVSSGSKRAQLFSSAFYALTHGTNDAQKTMGIIAALLVATGVVAGGKAFTVPTWVILASATAMGLGTLFGGWRIIRTMASKITHLTPIQGFAAETGGGVVLVGMAQAGIPVSTTHAITASIMGVGATKRASAVSWGMGRRIVGAWILTIPAAAIVGFVSYFVVRGVVGG